jgi:hypothetical protein
MVPSDTLPINAEYLFDRTFLNAIIQRSTMYLNKYTYCYQAYVSKRFSPFRVNDIQCNTSFVILPNHKLDALTEEQMENIPSLGTVVDIKTLIKNLKKDNIIIVCIDKDKNYFYEYYSIDLIEDIINKDLRSEDYIDKIIYNYMNFIDEDIDSDRLSKYTWNHGIRTYMYLPIVIYILQRYYTDYFRRPSELIDDKTKT